jgi:conserved oligomeric Golgi complex subunit 6
MRVQCEEAQAQLQSTNEACKSLLDRAESLRDER